MGSWAAMLVAFATSPQGERLIAAAVTAIVDRVLAARGLGPVAPLELEGHARDALAAVAARAQASGDAFDAAAEKAGGP